MFSKKSVKIIIGFVAVILVVWVAFDGLPKYQNWQNWKNIRKQAEEFEMKQKEFEVLIKADNYGGKTPQETLEMFIKAVEAGNYELASKYFVVEKQGEELKSLQEAKKSDIDYIMQLLKETKNISGNYSEDKKTFLVRKPILVEYILYPSNIWKINEI